MKISFGLTFSVVDEVLNVFTPEAIVCQCGVDALAGDPMNCFNLTHQGLGECVNHLTTLHLPLLLLGGGRLNINYYYRTSTRKNVIYLLIYT